MFTILGGFENTWSDCVLPINIINNTIFSLLWFWLVFLFLASIYSLIKTSLNMRPSQSAHFLGHHLQAHALYSMRDNEPIGVFIRKCAPDLILMLRLYEIELGNTLTGEIIAQIFLKFQKNYVWHFDLPTVPKLETDMVIDDKTICN